MFADVSANVFAAVFAAGVSVVGVVGCAVVLFASSAAVIAVVFAAVIVTALLRLC